MKRKRSKRIAAKVPPTPPPLPVPEPEFLIEVSPRYVIAELVDTRFIKAWSNMDHDERKIEALRRSGWNTFGLSLNKIDLKPFGDGGTIFFVGVKQ